MQAPVRGERRRDFRGSLSRTALFWRIFLANAGVFAAATALLALTPITVSSPIVVQEAVILVAGLAALLVLNVVLTRLILAPLAQLTELMQRVDILRPADRLPPSGTPEVADVISAFNDMLERLEHERRASSRRVLAGQEAERRRIARELHDEIGQTLTAVILELKRIAERAPADVREEVLEAQETARQSLDEMRRIARQLRPGVLDDLGLPSALSALASSFSEATGIPVERRLALGEAVLDADCELALYRIAQESLTNVARHAAASRVVLSLAHRNGEVRLAVMDDGCGFGAVGDDGGGIRGMRERALLVGGLLTVAARPGGGSEVLVSVPAGKREEVGDAGSADDPDPARGRPRGRAPRPAARPR